MKRKDFLIVPLLMGVAALAGSIKQVAIAENPASTEKPPGQVLCYAPKYIPPTATEIDNSLEKLENQYKEGKISKETYEVRKQSLQDQRKDVEDEGEDDEI